MLRAAHGRPVGGGRPVSLSVSQRCLQSNIFDFYMCTLSITPRFRHPPPQVPRFRVPRLARCGVAEVPEVPGSRFRPSRERRGWVVSGRGGVKLRTGSEVPGSEGGAEPRTGESYRSGVGLFSPDPRPAPLVSSSL